MPASPVLPLLLVFSSLTAPVVSVADVPDDRRESAGMMEILVTRGRMEQAATLPAAVQVITAREIEESGAQSVGEVLQNKAGIQIRDLFGDGSRATVSMRGFGANAFGNTLILLNGRKLNNQLDIAPPQLTSLAVEEIERIEIVQGSAGVLYGENAVGGVINIITRRPRHKGLQVQAETGSYDREAYRAALHQEVSEGLRLHAHASSLDTDNYRVRNRRQDRKHGVGLTLEQGTHRLFAEWTRQDEDLQLPGALTLAQAATDRRQADNAISFNYLDSDFLRAGWHFQPSDTQRVEIDYGWRDDDVDGQLSFFAAPCPLTQGRAQWNVSPRIAQQLGQRGAQGMVLTAGWDHEESDYQLNSCLGPQSASQQMDAVYLQIQWPLSSQLDLLAGIRRYRVETRIQDGFTFPTGTDFDDSDTVRDIGLEYRPRKNLALFLRRAENFRFGKVDEHTNPSGNAPLRTQTGVSWETGLRLQHARGNVGLLVYHLALEDEIAFDPFAPPFGGNRNLDPTERIGWQVDYRHRLRDAIEVHFSHAYVKARFEEGVNAGRDIPFVAGNKTTLSLSRQVRPDLVLGVQHRFVGDRYADGDDGNQFPKIKRHNQTDLYLNWNRGRHALNLRCNNLANELYNTYGNAPSPIFGGNSTVYPAPERHVVMTWKVSL